MKGPGCRLGRIFSARGLHTKTVMVAWACNNLTTARVDARNRQQQRSFHRRELRFPKRHMTLRVYVDQNTWGEIETLET